MATMQQDYEDPNTNDVFYIATDNDNNVEDCDSKGCIICEKWQS